MQTKLHINLSKGIVDVEGDVDLVREVYSDFKDRLLANLTPTTETPKSDGHAEESKKVSAKRKRRSSPRKVAKADGVDGGIDPHNPKLDKDLDLSELPAFFGRFEPKNNAEKILIFAKFLIEELDIESPNTDQFYTCFVELKEKIPAAFDQAFRDTHGRAYGYIEYKSATEISVPIMGTNHFNDGIKRKDAE